MQAFLFPGQGSQAVGMGKALSEAHEAARAVFAEVDEALGMPLSRLMWEGPAEELTLTANAQPALMAVSLAVVRVLEAGGVKISAARYVAGHSLGEYSALAAAGALDIGVCARLLRLRGEAMQKAVPVGEGAMAAILGLDFDAVAKLGAEAAKEKKSDKICTPANDNAPGQVVLSGHKAAIERAIELAKAAGAKRALPLPVSAPFHCALMGSAQEAMAEALADVQLRAPAVPLIANVRARPVTDAAEIKQLLIEQVSAPVRWRESMQFLAEDGVSEMAELGAGKVLSGLARRNDERLSCRALGAPEEIDAFLAEQK